MSNTFRSASRARGDEQFDALGRLGLIARAFTTGTDVELFDAVLAQAVSAVRASGGMLALLGPGGALRVVAMNGYPPGTAGAFGSFGMTDEFPASVAARTRQPVWVPDATTRLARFPLLATRHADQIASASLPLEFGGEVLGVLGVSYATEHEFSKDERTFLRAVADQCALLLRLRHLSIAGLRADQLAKSGIVGVVTGEGDIIAEANDAFLDLVGYERKDLDPDGLNWRAITPLDQRAVDSAAMAQLLAGEPSPTFEKEFERKDGTRVPVLVAPALLSQDPLRWTSIVIDLTERRRAEAALAHAHALLDAAVSSSPVGFAFLDENLRFVRVNDVLAEASGVAAGDVAGRRPEEVVDGLPSGVPALLRAALHDGTPRRDVRVTIRPERRPRRDVLLSCYPLRIGGEPAGLGLTVVDITEENRSHAARFHAVIDNMLDGVVLARPLRDTEGTICDFVLTYANRACQDAFGHSLNDFVGWKFLELWPSLEDSGLFRNFVRAVDNDVPVAFEGVSIKMEVAGMPAFEVVDFQAAAIDEELLIAGRLVTERVEREHRMQRQQRELEEAQRIARLGSWYWDAATNAVSWSPELYRIYGLPEGIALDAGITLRVLSPNRENALRMAQRAIELRSPVVFDQNVAHPDGTERIMQIRVEADYEAVSGDLLGMRGTTQDVTELRATQQTLDAATEGLDRKRAAIEILQRTIMPSALPQLDGVEIATRYISATNASTEELALGGDWFDVFTFGDDLVALTIGDVVGHGLTAVDHMVQMRTALRMALVQTREPHHAIDALESFVAATLSGAYATAIACVFDAHTGRLRWTRAGHLPFIVRRGNGVIESPEHARRPPIGTKVGPSPRGEMTLEAGDAVLLYTDGLVERRSESINVGIARLATGLLAAGATPSEMCEAAVAACLAGVDVIDDVCLLALARR